MSRDLKGSRSRTSRQDRLIASNHSSRRTTPLRRSQSRKRSFVANITSTTHNGSAVALNTGMENLRTSFEEKLFTNNPISNDQPCNIITSVHGFRPVPSNDKTRNDVDAQHQTSSFNLDSFSK